MPERARKVTAPVALECTGSDLLIAGTISGAAWLAKLRWANDSSRSGPRSFEEWAERQLIAADARPADWGVRP